MRLQFDRKWPSKFVKEITFVSEGVTRNSPLCIKIFHHTSEVTITHLIVGMVLRSVTTHVWYATDDYNTISQTQRFCRAAREHPRKAR